MTSTSTSFPVLRLHWVYRWSAYMLFLFGLAFVISGYMKTQKAEQRFATSMEKVQLLGNREKIAFSQQLQYQPDLELNQIKMFVGGFVIFLSLYLAWCAHSQWARLSSSALELRCGSRKKSIPYFQIKAITLELGDISNPIRFSSQTFYGEKIIIYTQEKHAFALYNWSGWTDFFTFLRTCTNISLSKEVLAYANLLQDPAYQRRTKIGRWIGTPLFLGFWLFLDLKVLEIL